MTALSPICFASPTTFTPAPESRCRACPSFADCGREVLGKVRAYAKTHPLNDLAEYLEGELKRAAVLPAGEVGGEPTPLPEASVELTVEVPERTFDRIARKELLPEEVSFLSRLPKKVADRMRPMFKRGTFREFRDAWAAEKNPFAPDQLPYLHAAATLLLQSRRLTKGDLRQHFMERFGWSEGTSFSRVAVVSRIFLEFGFVTDDGHCLIVAPRTDVQPSHNS